MTASRMLYIGLDVHQESMAIANGAKKHRAEVISPGFFASAEKASGHWQQTQRPKGPA
jgi:hypothetical protein